MYDENLIEFLGEDVKNYNQAKMQFEFSNVACGMRIPGVENLRIDYPVSRVDIKPTLAQICGLEDNFSLGTSIFEKKPYICINNGKFPKLLFLHMKMEKLLQKSIIMIQKIGLY